jgi:hypothetical protein
VAALVNSLIGRVADWNGETVNDRSQANLGTPPCADDRTRREPARFELMQLPRKAAEPSTGTHEFRLLSEVRIAKARGGVTYLLRPKAMAGRRLGHPQHFTSLGRDE